MYKTELEGLKGVYVLKIEAEGREFSKVLRSLEQFIQSVKVSTIFVTECFFNLFLEINKKS